MKKLFSFFVLLLMSVVTFAAGTTIPGVLDGQQAVITKNCSWDSMPSCDDSNCFNWVGDGDEVSFAVTNTQAAAYAISFDTATPCEPVTVEFLIIDEGNDTVYGQTANVVCTGDNGGDWAFKEAGHNTSLPATPVLPVGNYTVKLKFHQGTNYANFTTNLKDLTFTAVESKFVYLHGENFDKEHSTNDLYQFADAEGFTLTMNSRDINKTPCNWTDANSVSYTDGINFKNNDPGTINIPEGYKVTKLEIGGLSQSDAGNLCYLYTVDKDDVNFFKEPIGQNVTDYSDIESTAKYPIFADGNAPLFASLDFSAAPATKSIKVVFSGNNQEDVWFKAYYTTGEEGEGSDQPLGDPKTMAHWSFNYGYDVADGVGTPNATAITSNQSVNLNDVALLPNEGVLTTPTLTAHRPTGTTEVVAQDSKGSYQEVNAINCDGAALHLTSPVPTPETASSSVAYGTSTVEFPGAQAYSYQAPYNYYEIAVNAKNFCNLTLEVKAAGHNSISQYYAVACSTDKTTWTIVGDEYLTGKNYNNWNTCTIELPDLSGKETAYIRLFPADNWKGAGNNVNSDNQFNLDDVYLYGVLTAKEAVIDGVTIDGQTVTASEAYDYECMLPKTYTAATTTFSVSSVNATVTATAVDEETGSVVAVTDNGNGTFTVNTPAGNKATVVTLTPVAVDGAMSFKSAYTFRMFHTDEVFLTSLTIDGVEVSADLLQTINTGDAFTATLSTNVYTAMPVVEAKTIDGGTPTVTSSFSGNTATYTLATSERTFTLNVGGIYIYNKGANDEEYSIVYSSDGKNAYVADDQWTDGWTDGLYTLRTTSLDGWGGQQFKFNAANQLLEVPGGVVVKTFTLEKFGANYGDGEGLTAMSSDGATFRVPTKHGYTRGAKDNLTVVVENHKAGEPIAFTITGGNQPYAQLLLVIEKTNPGTTPAVMTKNAAVVNNHAMVSVKFDREMSSADVTFNGEEVHADYGQTLNFGLDNLDYDKDYTFTIPAGKAEDLFGNKTTEDITVNFTVAAQAPVAKKVYDYVVGSADEFTNVIKGLGNSTDKTLDRVTIFLKNGDYNFGADNEQRINRGNVSLIGQSRDGVVLHGTRTGISNPILNIRDREGFYLQDITVRNDLDFRTAERKGVGVAIYGGNKSVFKNVQMQSQQDTHVTGERSYYDQCRIQGTVDYICGGGDQFFDQCELVMEGTGSVISAPATTTTTKWGYVFSHCTIDRAEAGAGASMADKGDYALSRPWQNEPRTYYLFTKMNIQPSDNGYAKMGDLPTHFYEYGSVDKDGNEIDLSVRGNSPSSTNSYVPVISADEAKKFTIMNVLSGTDGWLPTDYTTLTDAPVASVDGKTISWADDSQVRAYVIFKDGEYVADITETSYTVTEDGTYTIYSANEMGGLSKQAATVVIGADAIDSVQAAAQAKASAAYNLAGQQVSDTYKGIVIQNGKKLMK